MSAILATWLLSALVILVGSYLIPNVHVDGFLVALIVALVLGIINAFIKPVLVVLTLPITVLTLGLFVFVINALMIMLTDAIVPGFESGGFLSALLFSILLTLTNIALRNL